MTAAIALLPQRAVAGMLLGLAGFAGLATADTLVKLVSARLPTLQILFLVFLVQMLIPVLWTLRAGWLAALRTRRPLMHLGRGLLLLAASVGFFYALGRLPLADAYALAFSTPLMITALSVVIVGEPAGPRRLAAVLIGFLGVLVALRPGFVAIDLAALGALGCAFCWSLATVLIRRLGAVETAESFAFYGSLVVAVGIAPLAMAAWVPPQPGDWPLLAVAGCCGGSGVLMVTVAFRLAPSTVVAPFQYVQMPIGIVVGYLLFGDRPDAFVLLGAAIVISSGLYLLRGEARAG